MVSPGEQGGTVSQDKQGSPQGQGGGPARLAWKMSLATEDGVHLGYK